MTPECLVLSVNKAGCSVERFYLSLDFYLVDFHTKSE